eukprot:GDKI01041885.1.p1 GENE.GDKI01041885.1~~GDKI01041885.1.p1  ORF type:complete len:429 (-),score=119.66 GDKI01041885.1:397-1683(-)
MSKVEKSRDLEAYQAMDDIASSKQFIEGIPETMSTMSASIAILVSMIGTGVVAMPYAMRLTGTYLGIGSLCFMGFLAWLSMHSLVKACAASRSASYEALAEKSLGMNFRRMSDASVVFVLVGTVTAYIIIASNIIRCFVPGNLPDFVAFAAVALAMFPVCLARSYGGLSFVASFCFTSFLFISFSIIVRTYGYASAPGKAEHPAATFSWIGVLLSLPMTGTAMNCHTNVPQVFAELNRGMKNRASALLFAVTGVACAFYLAAGLIPYWVFGADTQSDILSQLAKALVTSKFAENSDALIVCAQALLGVSIILKTPLMCFPLRSVVLAAVDPSAQLATTSQAKNMLVTGSSLAFCYVAALCLPKLDLVIQLMGATAGNFLVFVAPGIFSLCLEGASAKPRAYFMIVIGVVMAVASLTVVVGKEGGYIEL